MVTHWQSPWPSTSTGSCPVVEDALVLCGVSSCRELSVTKWGQRLNERHLIAVSETIREPPCLNDLLRYYSPLKISQRATGNASPPPPCLFLVLFVSESLLMFYFSLPLCPSDASLFLFIFSPACPRQYNLLEEYGYKLTPQPEVWALPVGVSNISLVVDRGCCLMLLGRRKHFHSHVFKWHIYSR